MKKRLTFFLSLFFIPSRVLATFSCPDWLSLPSESKKRVSQSEATENFISYLTLLIEAQALTLENILSFISQLEKGSLPNPFSLNQSAVDSKAHVHREAIDEYLRAGVDRKKLLAWLTGVAKKRLNRLSAEMLPLSKLKKLFNPWNSIESRPEHLTWEKCQSLLS